MTNVKRLESDSKKSIVLAGIDFLDLSSEVLEKAAELAACAGGELHVVHVLSSDDVTSVHGERALGVVSMAADARAKLEKLAAALPSSVRRIFLHLGGGKADVEIAQLASDIDADLIVVGIHGHSAFDRLIVGSVAESLLRHAPCPVLAYRPKTIPIWEQIAPPCHDCLGVQRSTGRDRLWCDRHSEHHPRAHTYSEFRESYELGSMTFR